MLPPVIKTITVPCSPDRAFELFTRDFAIWWPADRHSLSAMSGEAPKSVEADPRLKGEIWEIDHGGARQLWGHFTEFEPAHRLSISWHVGRKPTEATRVSVTFAAKGKNTEVVLSHSGWEALGPDAANMRQGYDNGWVSVFETAFKAACMGAA
jgi:uncharacterized protein YndB with AHSA1/START domain